ncbi:MAG: hypothetical protein WC299_13155, partial [Kiritimatiellia bacterium]
MKKNLCCKPQISARPYQLMCVLCRLGAGDPVNRLRDGNLDDIFQSIRKDPRVTLDLRSYEGDKYTGKDGDSPRGVLFHMYQDEAIRGSVKNPKYLDRAQAGLGRLLDIAEFIATIKNICWFDRKAAPAWRGCPLADKGYYELGRKRIKTISAEILPAFNAGKSQAELDAIKKNTAQKILDSNLIRIFPSHLAYIVNTAFQYECRRAVPIHHDNLWEPAEAMRRNPEIPVMLVPDHCMVCPPCGGYDMEGSGLCRINPLNMKPADKINAMGGVVTLSILRSLGLEYYQKIPAHRLLQLAKERLTADHILFNYVGAPPSFAAFERTLQDGLGFLDAFKDPKAVLRRVETLLADRRVRALLPQDEREYAGRTVAEVKKHIASGNRYEAYLALTESAFAHTWKQYMELIQRGYARLPKMIQAETGVAAADRVLKAIPVKRNIGKSMPVPYSTGFVTVPGVNRPAIAETGLRSGYDRDNLYVEIVCADADARKLKADARVGVDL